MGARCWVCWAWTAASEEVLLALFSAEEVPFEVLVSDRLGFLDLSCVVGELAWLSEGEEWFWIAELLVCAVRAVGPGPPAPLAAPAPRSIPSTPEAMPSIPPLLGSVERTPSMLVSLS